MAEGSWQLIGVLDAAGRFVQVGAAATSLLKRAPDLLIGHTFADLVRVPERTLWEAALTDLPHALGASRELPVVLPGERSCQGRLTPVHGAGATSALVLELRTVSDQPSLDPPVSPAASRGAVIRQGHALQQLQQGPDRAQRASEADPCEAQRLEAVSRLAGGVAHDFNNLLMIISGFAAAAARHAAANRPATAALAEIDRAVERAAALTKQLLSLSRRQSVQPRSLDLGAIVEEMASVLARIVGPHVTLTTDLATGLARVRADRAQIEQIVVSLALNAREAMARGGKLTVSLANAELAEGVRPQAGDPRYVALSVSDSGNGMDEATQARLFEPFFSTKPHGTGLGLYTVQRIARTLQGKVDVASALGRGTTVVLYLPAADAPREPSAREPARHMRGEPERVLVVEDEESVRSLLVDLLQRLGYVTLAAGNATEALALLSEGQRIDLLLTDVVMPGRSGWELAADVLSLQPQCCVLYVSGHAAGSQGEASMRATRGDLLHKPFSAPALAARVRALLDRRASHVSS